MSSFCSLTKNHEPLHKGLGTLYPMYGFGNCCLTYYHHRMLRRLVIMPVRQEHGLFLY